MLIHGAVQRMLRIQEVLSEEREVLVINDFWVDPGYILLSAFQHSAISSYCKLGVTFLCLLPHETYSSGTEIGALCLDITSLPNTTHKDGEAFSSY